MSSFNACCFSYCSYSQSFFVDKQPTNTCSKRNMTTTITSTSVDSNSSNTFVRKLELPYYNPLTSGMWVKGIMASSAYTTKIYPFHACGTLIYVIEKTDNIGVVVQHLSRKNLYNVKKVYKGTEIKV